MKQYFFSKILVALFVLALVLTLASCNKEETEKAENDTVTTEDVVVPDESRAYMKLDENVGIFCTRQWSPEISSASEKIAKAIKEKTGLELQIVYEADNKGSQIVVGYAEGSSASCEAYKAITLDQYAVAVDGSNAVLAAYTVENLEKAVDEFIATSIVKQNDTWSIGSVAPSDKHQKEATSISEYKIVYSAEAEDYIVNETVPLLQDMIFDRAKVRLEAVSDAEPATEHEIVIGNTNRSTKAVGSHFEGENAFKDYRSAVIIANSRVFLIGGESASMGVSVAKLANYIIDADYGPKLLDLDAKNYISKKMITTNPSELADGADVRVMSYNVLNPEWGDASRGELNKVESRIDSFIDLALYYRPDVIGVQEAAYDWQRHFDKYLVNSGMYKQCCNSNDSKYIMTGFLYNPSTLDLVDSYIIDIDPKSDIRVVSVAVFETLASGERFVLINTHPAPQSQKPYAEHMKAIMDIESAEMEKYKDLPILLTGDFNTYENQAEYVTLKDTLKVENVKDKAEQILNNYVTNWFKKPVECKGTCCIDHIFVNENVDVKLYSAVIHDGIELGSDHIPIYADVSLGKGE